MDALLKKLIEAAGVSGYESEISDLMKQELKKRTSEVTVDTFGNVVARKGNGKRKIMVAAHMDEIGLMVKHVTKSGFLHFIKVGGIDDRVLPGQRVIVKSRKGNVPGMIGAKPPHLQKDEERKQPLKYENMFIDIGAKNADDALAKVEIADPVIFEPNSGNLGGKLCYGKAIDNRVGCYVLLKIMEQVSVTGATVFAVATVQEEVGLKGARTSSFGLDPYFALALDTTCAGDTPGISETESALKLGGGTAITIIEAGGRGLIVHQKVKDLFLETAKKNKIKFQIDVVEGGMTDAAIISMTRSGILAGVLAVPTRYVHAPTSVFNLEDVDATVELGIKVLERVARGDI